MKTQHHKTLRIAAALALTVMLSGQAFAEPPPAVSNNATADVTVRLIQPISIEKKSDLNFGSLLTGGSEAIYLSALGTFTHNGRLLPSVGSQPQLAQFDVSGEPNLSYSITFGDDGFVVLSNENLNTLIVGIDANVDSTQYPNSGVLSDSGSDSIRIGGFFSMNNQARGTYTAPGGINVTVNYD